MSGSCALDLAILGGGGPVSQEAASNRGSWGCIGQRGWQLEAGLLEGEPQDILGSWKGVSYLAGFLRLDVGGDMGISRGPRKDIILSGGMW